MEKRERGVNERAREKEIEKERRKNRLQKDIAVENNQNINLFIFGKKSNLFLLHFELYMILDISKYMKKQIKFKILSSCSLNEDYN